MDALVENKFDVNADKDPSVRIRIYLFRKVLREAHVTVFGRQECVVGKNYTTILFYLFIFNSRRDRVKDLTGSGSEDDVRRKSRSR